MGKAKKGTSGANHLRARLEYLQKAAAYLQPASPDQQPREPAGQTTRTVPRATASENNSNVTPKTSTTDNLSKLYISQMRGVSAKTQLRLPIEVKRSFCKRCDTLLRPDNCVQEIRNESRGKRKPWADVWVVRCVGCGTEKRFPQTQKRTKKLAERKREREKEQPTET